MKDELRKLADQLPDDATWEDAVYEAELRRKLERGLAESAAGQMLTVDEVRRRLHPER